MADPLDGWFDDSAFSLPSQAAPDSEAFPATVFDADEMIGTNTTVPLHPSASLDPQPELNASIPQDFLVPTSLVPDDSMPPILPHPQDSLAPNSPAPTAQTLQDFVTSPSLVPLSLVTPLEQQISIGPTTHSDEPFSPLVPPPVDQRSSLNSVTLLVGDSLPTEHELSAPTMLSRPIVMEEFCRLCLLRSDGDMLNLFDDDAILENIWTVVQLELHVGDGLPDHVCQHCIHQLKSALEFVQQCHSSDYMLRDYLCKLKLARSLDLSEDGDASENLVKAVLERELSKSTLTQSPEKPSNKSILTDETHIDCEVAKPGNTDGKTPSPQKVADFGQNSILSRLLQRPTSGSSLLPPFSNSLERSFSAADNLDRTYASHDQEQSFSSHLGKSYSSHIQERSLCSDSLENTLSSDNLNNSYSSHIEDHPCDKLRKRWEAEGHREAVEESSSDVVVVDEKETTELNNNIQTPGSVKIICVQINDPAKITNGRIVNLNRSMKINDRLNVPMYVLSNDTEKVTDADQMVEATPDKVDSLQESETPGNMETEAEDRSKFSPHLRNADLDGNMYNGVFVKKTYYHQRGLENGRHAIYLDERDRKERRKQDANSPHHKLMQSFFINNPSYDEFVARQAIEKQNSTKGVALKRKRRKNKWNMTALFHELLSHRHSDKHEQELTVCVTSTDSVSTGTDGEVQREVQHEEEAPAENGAEELPAEVGATDAGVEYVLEGSESSDGVQYVLYPGSGENGETESPAAGKSFGNSELLYFDVQEEVVVETDDQQEVAAVEVQQVVDQAEPEPGVSGECVYEVKTEPTDEYPFVCEICGKAFKRRNALLSHMKLHTFINFGSEHDHRKNVYKCDVCFKCYISKTGLNMHRNRVHETGNVPCPECEQSFPSRSQLAAHLKVHSQREYKCNRCFKTFQKRKTFVAHTQLHVQIIYKCDTCLKMFNVEEELNEHVKSHNVQEAATGSAQPAAPRSEAQVEQFQRMKFEYCLSYVGLVKSMFHDQPDMYAGFLDTIKDFKFQKINVQGLLVRISQLFKDHRELIAGFNTFMPHGFKIELPADDRCHPEAAGLLEEPAQGPDMDLDYSLSYLSQIKSMFANQPKIYNDFTYIIKEYKLQTMEIPEVIRRVSHLFRNYPELIAGFNSFLPPWCKINVNSNDKKEKEDIDPRDTTQPGTSAETAVPCNGDAKRKAGKRKSTSAADNSKKVKLELVSNDKDDYVTDPEFQLQVKVEDDEAPETEGFVVETSESGENHTYVHEEAGEAAEGETYVLEAEGQPSEEFFITVSSEVSTPSSSICSFVCHVCLQTFKQREALHDHMKSHGK